MMVRIHAAVACLGLCCCCAMVPAPGEAERRINDCGVNSLYALLRLCGHDVDLARLRGSMPVPGDLGLSMADLQDAARRHGLPLRGVKLSARDFPLQQPAIVLLKEGESGHYVVIQPTGTTGTLAMLLDFPRPPRPVDYSDLLERPDWTGLALVPERPNGAAWAAGGVALASGLALAAMLVRPRRRQSKTAAATTDFQE